MRQPLILAVIFLAGVAARDASAQSAAPPVEIGVDASTTLTSDPPGLQWGPRLVINFDGHNAMQFTTSLQRLSRQADFYQIETDLYLAAYRRLVHATGPIRVYATLGGGIERTVIVTPAVTFGSPPVTFPSTRGTEVLPAFTTGAAINLQLGRRAAIVFESSFVLSDTLGGRFSGGLVVPIGSYPRGPRSARILGALGDARPGRTRMGHDRRWPRDRRRSGRSVGRQTDPSHSDRHVHVHC